MDEWIIVDEQAFECTRCGQRTNHNLPKTVSEFNAMAQEFIRLHQDCDGKNPLKSMIKPEGGMVYCPALKKKIEEHDCVSNCEHFKGWRGAAWILCDYVSDGERR